LVAIADAGTGSGTGAAVPADATGAGAFRSGSGCFTTGAGLKNILENDVCEGAKGLPGVEKRCFMTGVVTTVSGSDSFALA